ncbi:transcription factor LUX-like [Impatiens glandulifera]|uniref:transcription factor LUX-like n=1 Tax=Impatiens glandulifera TaxID=253017 RepID=UPI001FB07555|nr:transcription factor LUX-like [Impatiens glandulifera]
MENENKERMMEWEVGLPNLEDLIPLSHCLLSPELMSAFNIVPEPSMNMFDVDQASRHTLETLGLQPPLLSSYNNFDLNLMPLEDEKEVNSLVAEGSDKNLLRKDDSKSKKLRGADLSLHADKGIDDSEKARKRHRIVWTPQLHKRFIDVVAHIGLQNAVPNSIFQMMNVEGLTRDNVASHLQKYRLYLNRKQELSTEPAHLASTSANIIRSKNG